MKQQETWETAALGSKAVFDGELDPIALMDGDRKKEKVSVTGRRVGETFRNGGYKDTHTDAHNRTGVKQATQVQHSQRAADSQRV